MLEKHQYEEVCHESDISKTFKSASRIISTIHVLSSTTVTHYFAGMQVEWSFILEKAHVGEDFMSR